MLAPIGTRPEVAAQLIRDTSICTARSLQGRHLRLFDHVDLDMVSFQAFLDVLRAGLSGRTFCWFSRRAHHRSGDLVVLPPLFSRAS